MNPDAGGCEREDNVLHSLISESQPMDLWNPNADENSISDEADMSTVDVHIAFTKGIQPAIGFRCQKCSRPLAAHLIAIASGQARCPDCGQSIVPGEGFPSLAALVKTLIYVAEHNTKDQPELALSLALAVLAVDDWTAAAHNVAGIVYDEKGRYDEAIHHFRLATELAPTQARYHYGFGVALLGQQRTDQARREFERALELFPDYIYAVEHLAACYISEHDWLAASLVCDRLCMMESDPDGPFKKKSRAMLHNLLAQAARIQPRWPKRPFWTWLSGQLTRTYVARIFHRYHTPGVGHVRVMLKALALLRGGEYEEAKKQFGLMRVLLPSDIAGYSLLCEWESIACFLLDEHARAYQLSREARRGLRCVSALVTYPGFETIPPLTPDIKRFYSDVLQTLFGVTNVLLFQCIVTDTSGALRRSLEALTDKGESYEIRRAGNLLRITTPAGEEVEHTLREGTYFASDGL